MGTISEHLLETALTLPDSARADLAARLIASLDPTIDADYESAWSDEIQKRISLLDSGAVQTIPWRQARDQITGQ
jgi:hypothetical protein